MMNDCQNVEVREVLPDVAHDVLPEFERAQVQEHLDACDDCAAELAIVRAVLASATAPPVDVSRIVAAIPPYRRRATRLKRVYLELAAACLVGAIGISTFAIHNSNSAAGVSNPAAASGVAVTSSGLALVSTSDLSDAGLAQLTQDLDKLQAMPTADPESVTPAALEVAAVPAIAGDSA
jgi:anti-sigma factor RsiW